MSPKIDLEQQEKYLVIESLNKTTSSCEFNAENLNVFAGCVEGNPSLGIVSSKSEVYLAKYNEEENCQARYDEECLSDEDQVDLLQQKEFISSLFNEGSNFNGDEVIMPYEVKFFLDEDKEELACLNSQRKIVGWTFRTSQEAEGQQWSVFKEEEKSYVKKIGRASCRERVSSPV